MDLAIFEINIQFRTISIIRNFIVFSFSDVFHIRVISYSNTIYQNTTYQNTILLCSFSGQFEDPMKCNLDHQKLVRVCYMTLTSPSLHYHMVSSSWTIPTKH